MRFIGNKTNLLKDLEKVINDNCDGTEKVFCDIFSGTSSVARYFKSKYQIISNDLLYFSYILQKATIENNKQPEFKKLKSINIDDPLLYLETSDIKNEKNNFIYDNYAPSESSNRMYLTSYNAKRIDYIRKTINEWKIKKLINNEEYYYLLASLLEGVPFVSNITGTYGAYLKDWDKRALKKFEMLRFNIKNNNYDNKCYNVDSNNLIKEIRGDILYIDPPYNSRQYLPNYHLLETIAKYDSPKLIGKTGIREYEEEKSKYCTKSEASTQLEDLIQNAKFNHIILSYNQDGILEKEQIEAILKKYGEKNTYKFYEIPYKKYLNKLTKKADVHFEYVFYIKKKLYDNTNCIIHSIELKEDCQVNEANEIYNITERGKFLKSPLNYIGGKYKLLPQLLKYFPKEANTFIDLFAGGFNVGLNYNSKKTICNDINNFIIDLYKKLYESKINDVLKHIDMRIKEYSLTKENEMGFKKFREYYNETRNPIDLYLLTCFSFNYQFRFNNSKKYNNPFGRNRSQYSEPMKKNLILFMNKIKDMNIEFTTEDFENININNLNSKDFIYCDPPYLITNASYNDGNRGFKDWKDTEEIKLYNFLDRVNNQGIKFAMTNVVEHKGKENVLLKEWSKKYNTINLYSDYSNSSYNTKKGESKEVLITNYNM